MSSMGQRLFFESARKLKDPKKSPALLTSPHFTTYLQPFLLICRLVVLQKVSSLTRSAGMIYFWLVFSGSSLGASVTSPAD